MWACQFLAQSPVSLPFPGKLVGGGVENFKFLFMAWSLVTSPHPEVIQEPTRSCLTRTKDIPLPLCRFQGIQGNQGQRPSIRTKDVPSALLLGNIKGFRSTVPGTLGRDIYIIFHSNKWIKLSSRVILDILCMKVWYSLCPSCRFNLSRNTCLRRVGLEGEPASAQSFSIKVIFWGLGP